MRPQSFLRVNSVSDLWTFVSEEAVLCSSWKFGNLSFLELCCHLSFGNFLVVWAAYWKIFRYFRFVQFFYSIHPSQCRAVLGESLTQHAPYFSWLCKFLVMLLLHQWITILVYLVDMRKHHQIKEMKYWCFLLLLWNRKSCYIRVCVLQIWQQIFHIFGCEAVGLQIIGSLSRRSQCLPLAWCLLCVSSIDLQLDGFVQL